MERMEGMDTIEFTFEETGETVAFAILSHVEYKETAYLLVADERDLEDEDMEAYILKAVEMDDEDVYYEIVDDEEEQTTVLALLEESLDDFDVER